MTRLTGIALTISIIPNLVYPDGNITNPVYVMPTIQIHGTKDAPQLSKNSMAETIVLQKPEYKHTNFVTEALRLQKSVQVTDPGVVGGLSLLTLRGTKATHTMVEIDGIAVNNPLNTGGYDWSGAMTNDFERITVAANPHYLNTIQASGGTIILVPARARDKPVLMAQAEQGSHPTQKIVTQIAVKDDKHDVFISTSYYKSGQGETGTFHSNRLADDHNRKSLMTNMGAQLTKDVEIRLLTQVQSSYLKLNQITNTLPQSSNTSLENLVHNIILRLNHQVSPQFKQSFAAAQNGNRQTYISANDYESVGDVHTVKYDNELVVVKDRVSIKSALESRQEKYKPAGDTIKTVENRFLNLGTEIQSLQSLLIQLSGRVHHLGLGGDHFTYQTMARYRVNSELTFKTGYGTGIRAPRLDEYYGGTNLVANSTLKPETSQSFETGFEAQLLKQRLTIDSSYFNTAIKDFITYVSYSGNSYKNLQFSGRRLHGLETQLIYKPVHTWRIEGVYTYTETADSEAKGYAIRLSRHKATLNLVHTPRHDIDFYTGLYYRSLQRDSFNKQFVNLDGYMTVRAGINYRVHRHVEIFSRIENIFNRKYEDIYGFGARGTEAYIGLKGSL